MDIVESNQGAVLTAAVSGRLDAGPVESFTATMVGVVDRGDRRVVLDLAALDYVSSVGLRSLIVVAKRLKPVGGQLVLCAPTPRLRQVLDSSGFPSMFTIAATRDEAAGAFR
jgi:stage II sporulation protein AA (anti-sigma F factor antagonist)